MIHFVWRYGIIDSELMSCQTLKMLSHFRRIDTFMEGLERLRVVCRYAFTITRPPTRQTLKMLSHFRCRFSLSLYQKIGTTKVVPIFWCGRQDLNLHGCPLVPKTSVSAIPPRPHILFLVFLFCHTKPMCLI